MLNLLRAELLKQKHRFSFKLMWIAPLVTVFLVVAMMAGSHFQDGAYNWWYTMLLPGSFTMFAALSAAGERRKNRHGLLAVVINKRQIWVSQIVLYTLYLFATCVVFFLSVTVGGLVFGVSIGGGRSALASFLLFITFAWQIPLWMTVTEKAGKFAAILLSMLCNFAIAVVAAVGEAWWMPFSIPARLMCAVIGVLPNGLTVEAGSSLSDWRVVLPGVFITVSLYILISFISSVWFEKRGVA